MWVNAVRSRTIGIVLVLLLGLGASAGAVPLDQATPAQLSAAQKTFQAANELYDAKRFDEAITAFRASHAIVASPNSSLMIARSLRELGRLGEAYTEIERAASEADAAAAKDDKYTATAKACHDELSALALRVGKIEVKVVHAPAGTTLRVGENEVDVATAKPVVVSPGTVAVVARGDGREVRRTVTVAAGETARVALDLAPPPAAPAIAPPPSAEPAPPAPAPAPKYRTLAYVVGGVGVAGLVGFGVFGALDNSKFNSLQSDCPGGHCAPDRGSDIDSGKTYQTLANVSLVVGVVGLGGGVALYVLGSHHQESTAARAPRRAIAIGPGSVSMVGEF